MCSTSQNHIETNDATYENLVSRSYNLTQVLSIKDKGFIPKTFKYYGESKTNRFHPH